MIDLGQSSLSPDVGARLRAFLTPAEPGATRAPYHVEHARAEDFLDGLPAGCVSLIFADLPYFGEKDEAWDNAWPDDAAFLGWVGSEVCERFRRVLAPNGSLYVCASARLGSRVEMVVRERFEVLSNIRWRKPAHSTKAEMFVKKDLRAPFPASETIIFAEQRGADQAAAGASGTTIGCDQIRGFVFEPLRAWFDVERLRSRLTSAQIQAGMAERTGVRYTFDRHTFSRSQWEMPTRAQYEAARDLFNAEGDPDGRPYLGRAYDEIDGAPERLGDALKKREDYQTLRAEYEERRRFFVVSDSVPYTDVWDFATVKKYPGKHPCEKPEEMMVHIIEASSRPGDVVLDCVAGSGAFPAVAVKLGRRAIACDADPHWADVARRRCEMARATGRTRIRKLAPSTAPDQRQLLLGGQAPAAKLSDNAQAHGAPAQTEGEEASAPQGA